MLPNHPSCSIRARLAPTTMANPAPNPSESLHDRIHPWLVRRRRTIRRPSLAWPMLTNKTLVVNTLNYTHLRTTACAYAPSDVVESGTTKNGTHGRVANLRLGPGTRSWTTTRRTRYRPVLTILPIIMIVCRDFAEPTPLNVVYRSCDARRIASGRFVVYETIRVYANISCSLRVGPF